MGLLVAARGDTGSFTPPTNAVIFDNFNYTLPRVDTYAAKLAIIQAHGSGTSAPWGDLRDSNQSAGRYGYLYTVAPADVPGHSGTFPGSTQKALLAERLPTLDGGSIQSDIFISVAPTPANIYYRYWIYLIHSGAMLSYVGLTNKHLYPTNGVWPASGDDECYISFMGCDGYQYYAGSEWTFGTNLQRLYFGVKSYKEDGAPEVNPGEVTINNTNSPSGGSQTGWQNLSSNSIAANTWAEVTEHFDVSGTQGLYEVWVRLRNGARVKVTEWIGGVTSGFSWATSANDRNGQAGMQFPSVSQGHTDPVISGHHYLLFQDFCATTSWNDLWVAGDEP